MSKSRFPRCCFNPRTRTGCDVVSCSRFWVSGSFNPRTRTGCDGLGQKVARTRRVSTHAPARGATYRLRRGYLYGFDVSTHAPARGATVPVGFVQRLTPVSTHAPARGATADRGRDPQLSSFQPTHPHGVRPEPFGGAANVLLFQPTHPHGVRPIAQFCQRIEDGVSTHAPARGATPLLPSQRPVRHLFQPTHPHGVRQRA